MRNGRDPESPEKKVKTSRRVCIHVGLGGNTREKSFSLPLSVSAAERGGHHWYKNTVTRRATL